MSAENPFDDAFSRMFDPGGLGDLFEQVGGARRRAAPTPGVPAAEKCETGQELAQWFERFARACGTNYVKAGA